jgi:hypothetical protein
VKTEAGKRSEMLVSYHNAENFKSLIWYRKIAREMFKCVAMKISDVYFVSLCVNTVETE